MKICPNCGKEVQDQDSFCTYCGEKLDSEKSVAEESASRRGKCQSGAEIPELSVRLSEREGQVHGGTGILEREDQGRSNHGAYR